MTMASGVRMKWYGPAVVAEADRRARAKLLQAGELVRAEAVKSISVPTSSAGPSDPGDPPHADTGKLRQSIMVRVDGDSVIVGSPLKYSLWLELGTSRMAARPFLAPAVYRMMGAIKRLFRSNK